MKVLSTLLLLVLPAFVLAPSAAATHCTGVLVGDDGTHSVSQTGTTVTVNGAGVDVECFGFEASLAEKLTLSTLMACPSPIGGISDDGAHNVGQAGGTVFVNAVGLAWGCAGVGVVVPENFFLP